MDAGSRFQHDSSPFVDYCTQALQAYWEPESSIFSDSLGGSCSSWLCIGRMAQPEGTQRLVGAHGRAPRAHSYAPGSREDPLLCLPSLGISIQKGLALPGTGQPVNRPKF